MNKFWVKLFLVVLLSSTLFGGRGAAAESDAAISARQSEAMILVSGKTAADSPEKVPVLITDADGQVIDFREVAGGGKPFAFSFEPPAETAKGQAAATLYTRPPVRISFSYKPVKEDNKQKIDVTLQILGYDGDEIFPQTTLKVTKGSSVFDLLQVAASEGDFEFEYEDADGDGHDVYVKSIDGLAEYEKGPESGWVYRVNGKGPQAPIDRYLVEPGDEVELLYTSDLGDSELGENGGDDGPRISYARTESVSVDKALHQLRYASDAEAILQVVESLLVDLGDYELEQQRAYLPDVKLFFRAAHERAAMLAAKSGSDGNTVEINLNATDVRDLLMAQSELLTKLQEELEGSTLYKPLLRDLKPTVLISLPEKSDAHTWQMTITPDAWVRLKTAGASLAAVRGDWRSVWHPAEAPGDGKPLVYRIRFYNDREQTEQVASLQTTDGSTPVPISVSISLSASHPSAAAVAFEWPLTGSLESGFWPELYRRSQPIEAWRPVPVHLSVASGQIHGQLREDGDFVVVAAQPSFQDLWGLPDHEKWVMEPVTALASVGVIHGVAPGQFGPHQPVTVSQFKAMLSRIDGKTREAAAPDRVITRAEIALLLAAEIQDESSMPTVTFTDAAAIPAKAASSVQRVASRGWMKGRADGRFDPAAGMTRGEAAAVLYRYWKSPRE